MAERKATFYEQAFILLDDSPPDAVAEGVKAAAAYFLRGEAPDPAMSPFGLLVFRQLRYYIDYTEKLSEAGKKGGRPSKQEQQQEERTPQTEPVFNGDPAHLLEPDFPPPVDPAQQEQDFENNRERMINLAANYHI